MEQQDQCFDPTPFRYLLDPHHVPTIGRIAHNMLGVGHRVIGDPIIVTANHMEQDLPTQKFNQRSMRGRRVRHIAERKTE